MEARFLRRSRPLSLVKRHIQGHTHPQMKIWESREKDDERRHRRCE